MTSHALPQEAAPQRAPGAAPAGRFARQPILDARRSIFGYALLDRSTLPAGPARDAELLLHALQLADARALGAQRVLFLRCTLETVVAGQQHLELLDPERIVLQPQLPPAIDAAAIGAALPALQTLHKRGLRFAFPHLVFGSAWRGCLPLASFVTLDMAQLPAPVLQAVGGQLRALPKVQGLATGVDGQAEVELAERLGLPLLQGSWFARPASVRVQAMRPSQATIVQLVNLVRRQAEVGEIETVLKRDAALSFNLLRFINSSGLGLSCEITSFRHAVMILGYQKLLRWAVLLMATARDGAAPAVGHTAVVRGRLMELLAAELLTPEECDNAFVAGVFSLLDAMTGMPLRDALAGISLPEPVLEALLHRGGVLGPFLDLAQACEAADDARFAQGVQALHLSDRQVNMAHLQALAWAEELLAPA